MRQGANSDESGFSPADFIEAAAGNTTDFPADTLIVDDASGGGLSVDNSAPGPVLDDASLGATPSSAPNDGGDWTSFWTNDDSFNFDASQNGENDQLIGDSSATAASNGFDGLSGASTSNFDSASDVAFTGTYSNLFQVNSPNGNIADSSGTSHDRADVVDTGGGTTPPANIASNVVIFNDPAPSGSPLSATSNGPILAWDGDLGSGVSHAGSSGSGGGSGSGSGGAVTHTTGASSGLVINVVYDASVANAPPGFTTAVAAVVSYYESVFTDPVTITIDVGYGEIDGQPLAANALGESETYLTSVSYAQLQSALVKNANAIGDTAAVASLLATSPVNGQYWISTAEAKALGIAGASSSVDGYIGFSSTANFAYNDSNGVAANQYDFFGVVAHEISEVMGRQMMDGANFSGGASYEPLDLFHYSAPGVLDFSGTTPGYASATGGITSLDSFNTNPNGDFGDWAASAGNNSYDAFSYPGVVNAVSASDLALMNLLGWDPAGSTSQTPAPTPVVTIEVADDTGASSTDDITSKDALTGTADPNAVVKLMLGTRTLGSTTANASGVWSFTPTGLTNGQYTIVASETNLAGNIGTASLTFTLDMTTPTVTSDTVSGTGISGGAGTLTAGKTAVLTLALSESVTVSGGVPALTLNDGGTATYDAVHSTSTSLVFDYTVLAGQYATAFAVTGINLNGATVTDVAGNAANFAGAAATFSKLVVDATPVAAADHAHDVLYGSVSISHAQAATGGVLANDSDPDPNDVLSVSAVNGSSANVGHSVIGAFGVLDLNSDGSYTYTNTNPTAVAAAGGVAEDTFNYTISNGHGGLANSTLTVLITSPGETYVSGAHGSTISGGTGSYVLDGSAGNMNVTASSGTQWLVGGPGDTLTAGNSADTFIFPPSFGKETINNFNTAHDTIDLPQSVVANFAAVAADMHASGANTVITLDANDAITLSHVAVADLHAQNFHFIV